MAELRKDPILGRWVIIASERGKRPQDFEVPHHPPRKYNPFAPGNEYKTPQEIMSYRPPGSHPNTPGWWVRVVPNKFPALAPEVQIQRQGEGMYDMMTGIGAHEVIVESPNPTDNLPSMSRWHVREVLRCFRDRLVDLKRDQRFKYILIFKNHGPEAGASVDHPHCQLIALPIVPVVVQLELTGAQKYFKYKERCIFCDMIDQELDTGLRIVDANDQMLAIAPFASRLPFETWILPKDHSPHYEYLDDTGLDKLAETMQNVIGKMFVLLEDPPYNFMLHTSPCHHESERYYHWHIEIVPQLSQVAGFEWGSGCYINSVPPEEAARFLRETKPPTPKPDQLVV